MKKLFFLSALIAGSLSIQSASAQIGLHLNINLGPRPVYEQLPPPPPAPVIDDEYYYLPDAEAYYSVPERVYYYENEGRWISSPRLVGRYRDYNYNQMRHFAVNEHRPYLRNDYYRAHFNGPAFAGRDNRDFRNQNFNGPRGRNDFARNNPRYDQHNQNQRDNGYRGGHDNSGNQNSYNRY